MKRIKQSKTPGCINKQTDFVTYWSSRKLSECPPAPSSSSLPLHQQVYRWNIHWCVMTNACLHLHTHNRWFWSSLAQHSPLFSDYDTPARMTSRSLRNKQKKNVKRKEYGSCPPTLLNMCSLLVFPVKPRPSPLHLWPWQCDLCSCSQAATSRPHGLMRRCYETSLSASV